MISHSSASPTLMNSRLCFSSNRSAGELREIQQKGATLHIDLARNWHDAFEKSGDPEHLARAVAASHWAQTNMEYARKTDAELEKVFNS